MCALGSDAFAADPNLLLYEPFDYSNVGGPVTDNTPGNWVTNNTGANDSLVTANSLVYPGLENSIGNSMTNGGAGIRVRRVIGTSVSTGQLYFSVLFRINRSGSWNGAAAETCSLQAADLSQRLTVFVKSNSPSGFVFGVQKTASTIIYDTVERHDEETILLVGKYDFTTSPNAVSLWINPEPSSFAASEPAGAISTDTGTPDGAAIELFKMFQNSSSSLPNNMHYDELRFGTTWASVTPKQSAPRVDWSRTFTGTEGTGAADALTLSGNVLYGTTRDGGTSDVGTVFKIYTDGTCYTKLANFTSANTSSPNSPLLVIGKTIYGCASGTIGSIGLGGGAIYKVNIDGTGFSTLKGFPYLNDAEYMPHSKLVLSGTDLYGLITSLDGGYHFLGDALFKISTNGAGYSFVHTFSGNHVLPIPTLVGDTLYGVQSSDRDGNIFKVRLDGTDFSSLMTVPPEGRSGTYPSAGTDPVVSGDTVYDVGADDDNTVANLFKVQTNGSGFQVLKDNTWMSRVSGDLLLYGETFYASMSGNGASGEGVLYQMNMDGSDLTVLTYIPFGAYLSPGLVSSDGGLITSHPMKPALANRALYTPTYAATGNGAAIAQFSIPPTVMAQPKNQTTIVGQDATFTVVAESNPGTVFYQWRRNGSNLSDTANVSGSSSAALTLTGSQFADKASYSVTITDIQGTTTSAPATLSVKQLAPVSFTNLSSTYDGTAKSVSYSTVPSGLNVVVTYDGSSSAPTNAGSYTVVGVVNDPEYVGTNTATLVIDKAPATITLTNLNQLFDGNPKSVSVTTSPADLNVDVTYDGSSNAPTAAGSYIVNADIAESNYSGSATDTFIINGCPVITPGPLANGLLGIPYNETISTATGTAPYNYVLSSGSIPLGLTFTTNGNLSGTPFELGTNSFVISVTDSNGCAGSNTYSIIIGPSGDPLDTTLPSVAIKSPKNATVVSLPAATIIGNAKDTKPTGKRRTGVAVVVYRLNNGPLQLAATSDKWTNWSANVTLEPGWNTFNVQAFDFRGNASSPVTFTYLMADKTTVLGRYDGLFYEIATNAQPDAKFSSAGALVNLVPVLKGNYSGKLLLAGESFTIKGTFDLTGHGTNTVARNGKGNVDVDLHLDWTGVTRQLTGSVSCVTEGWTSPLMANLAGFGKTNPTTAATYTMVIPPANDSPANSPAGYGYGSVSVKSNGNITLSGAGADSMAISQTVPISFTGQWPLFVDLYRHQGLLEGWIDLSSGAPVGVVTWIKNANPVNVKLTTYPGGFTNVGNVFGSAYLSNVPALILPAGLLEITNGSGLPAEMLNATLNSSNKLVSLPPTTNRLSGSVVSKTGLLYVNYGPTGMKSITRTAAGIVVQSSNAAYGAFTGMNDGTGKTNVGSIYFH